MANKTSYTSPFYSHPMRGVQIIKENKLEIKKMQSQRPTTPFGRKRFEKEHNSPQVSSRPSSSSSLKSLKYDQEEDCRLSTRKALPQSVLQRRDGNAKDLKLEPLVTKSVLTPRRNRNSLMKSHSQPNVTFPPIQRASESLEGRRSPRKSFWDSYKALLEKFPDLEDEEKLNNTAYSIENSIKCKASSITSDTTPVICSPRDSLNDDYGSVVEDFLKQDSTSSLDANDNEDLNFEDLSHLSHELKQILYTLEKNVRLGPRRCDEQVQISIIHKLHNTLKDRRALQTGHPCRIPLLKTLFKLLDSALPALSLHTIKLLLEMKVGGKNLDTIMRLTSKLITNKQVNLKKYHIIEPLMEAVEEIPFNNKETLLCGVGILKSLLFQRAIEEQHLEKCAVIFMHHLKQFNSMNPLAEERWDDAYIDINKRIFTALYLLSDNDDVWTILTSIENLSDIMTGLSLFYQNSEVTQMIVRLISKVIDKEDGSQALAQCPEQLVMAFSLILQTHRYNVDITMQTTFIIENLVLVDKKVAETFLRMYNLHDVLIEILEEYVKEHIESKRTISPMFKINQECGDLEWRDNVFEVITRILSILANICLSPEAGCSLAQETNTILHLSNIVAAYLKQETLCDTSFPVYSFLVVIGNISYYMSPDSTNCLKVAIRILSLLDDRFSFEVRKECAVIVLNLTRSTEVRKYIAENLMFSAFMRLLSEEEFNDVAYGIMMNLLLDRSNCEMFYKEQGIARVIHKLHLCTERDWKMSSVLCQLLWNYCEGYLNEDAIPISELEVQHLIKYLSYSTGGINETLDEKSDDYSVWKNDFCPVSENLLILLQSQKAIVNTAQWTPK